MPLTLRSVKGSRLTIAEMDGNLQHLQSQIDTAAVTYDPVVLTINTTLTAVEHANRLLICNNASPITLTLQTDALGGFSKDDSINAIQYGIGSVTIAQGTATVREPLGSANATTAQYTIIGAVRLGLNEWTLSEAGASSGSGNSATPEKFALSQKRHLVSSGYTTTDLMGSGIRVSNTILYDSCTASGQNDTYFRVHNYNTAAAAVNRICGLWNNSALLRRDRLAPTWGGWPATIVAGMADASPTLGTMFLGITDNSNTQTNTLTTIQPSAMINILGIGFDSTDTNWQIMHNDATGTATKIDLGTGFPRAQWVPMCVTFTKNNSGTGVYVKVVNMVTNATFVSSEITTNISSGTTSETVHAIRGTMSSAFTASLEFGGFYLGGE